MPITQSAKKALRQSIRRRARNFVKREAYKDVIKNIRKFSTAGKVKEAQNLLPQLYKALDKAAKTHVIKKNKAARIKSRLTKLVQGRP
jgi:small subunit ribosomal protein S20